MDPEVWDEIPADLVARSFKSWGISNTLNGTEDDAVWGEETGEAAGDHNKELEKKF